MPIRTADWRGSHNYGLEQFGGGRQFVGSMSPGVVDIAAERHPRTLHAAMKRHANPLRWSHFQGQDWQIRQAEHALRIYFVNFLQRTDWRRRPQTAVVDGQGRTNPLAALEELRLRIRTRQYSYRTESSYGDWVRRFLAYVGERQQAPHPRVDSAAVRDYLTYLTVRQQVSASTQNQALCAILFLCREVLDLDVEGLALTARAKRGPHLPVVLSVPETTALLGAMRGMSWLMAAVIHSTC